MDQAIPPDTVLREWYDVGIALGDTEFAVREGTFARPWPSMQAAISKAKVLVATKSTDLNCLCRLAANQDRLRRKGPQWVIEDAIQYPRPKGTRSRTDWTQLSMWWRTWELGDSIQRALAAGIGYRTDEIGIATRTSSNDERDEWLWNLANNGVLYKQIVSELRDVGPKKGWSVITSTEGVKAAIKRFVERKKVNAPEPRMRGRPSTKPK